MLTIRPMKTQEAIQLFDNSVRQLAESLQITTAAVYQWGDTVPPLRAYQIRDLVAQRQASAIESSQQAA